MRSGVFLPLVLVAAVLGGGCAGRCVVKPGERADFYPTPARYDAASHSWKATPEGRIYEPR